MGLFTRKLRLLSDPQGVFQGPPAHAFACGAHMPVAGRGVWNALHSACACCDADDNRAKLRDSWGITDTPGWEQALSSLVSDDRSPDPLALVLDLRAREAARLPGAPFDAGSWPELIGRWCWAQGADPSVYPSLVDTAARVWEYEERMAEDGVLPRGTLVRTVRAYDLGRAVNLARWGVSAGHGDPETALRYVLRAGAASMRHYGSWEEMSAGFVLGRAMAFDEGRFGPYYTDSVAAHRVLTTDPLSPWRNLPWHM
ncbi:DUF1266 domain-containing protein [Nocardiopsis algeriensis]|uniref:DUF1266 domain-containing protein n=1 Tax=Nocardiopsis algeriensis TaxID=1478215 RepID=A0A841IV77_9ACTN|nr:DUF1266 domain-containing protein [Nocardiopsis algeriensis]MBB6120111.1 hypothetical protein [Nocardiopsis algeriensis]